ncbi:MAG: hypothetical protein Q4D16_19700 [Eubacteriales bacterium]|nr:hypothetical protein [Eubacteriales bacterium]
MFERYGEMDSYQDINSMAEGLFNGGELDGLKMLAKENGIPEEYVDLYTAGEIPVLCDAMTAAMGKLDIECKELKPKEIMEDWVEYIRGQCAESDEMAKAVREKGKTLKDCIAALLSWSFKNQQNVNGDIVKAAGISTKRVTLGIPGMGRAKKIIKDYYTGGEENA